MTELKVLEVLVWPAVFDLKMELIVEEQVFTESLSL